MSETIQISAMGEHVVMTNLIEQGWSVAKPLPDIGIDLLAIKVENDKVRVRCIQVKTSKRYNQVKNICRKKSHNLYGFKFKKVIQGCEYWFVFLLNDENIIKKLTSDELKKRIGLM